MNDQLERALAVIARQGEDPGAETVWERASEAGRRRRRRRQLRTGLSGAVVVALAIAGIAVTVNRRDSGPQRIIVDVPPVTHPSTAPSKNALSFTRDDTIWTVEPSGVGRRAITRQGCCTGSTWSPDHREIAIGDDDDQLTIVSSTGKVVRSFDANTIFQPSWSPDGTQIAFAASPAGSFNGGPIEIVDANGTHAPRVVANVFAGQVAWSPDGTQIAFTALDEPIHIEILTISTGKVTPLTSGPGAEQWDPTWSAANGRIAFASSKGLYEIAPDGRGLRQIVSTAQPCCQLNTPSWSPDGTEIVFTQTVPTAGELVEELFIADVSTRRVRRITSGTPGTSFPAW